MSDEAEIRQTGAITVRQLIEAGFKPIAAVEFVQAGNLDSPVGNHTGLTSVQLVAPGEGQPEFDAGDNKDG